MPRRIVPRVALARLPRATSRRGRSPKTSHATTAVHSTSMLRESGRKRGSAGLGEPSSAPSAPPGLGAPTPPEKKWFSVSMMVATSEPRAAVMTEFVRSRP